MISYFTKHFSDYAPDNHTWITLAGGEYYPDILEEACELYKPVLVMFSQLLKRSPSSVVLFEGIIQIPDGWMRIQLLRVFKRYVCPEISVEMTKVKNKVGLITKEFGPKFRAINKVQNLYQSRPIPDEALCALLWEYKSRGQKGYDLTEKFFAMFRVAFPTLTIIGPERAGKDILMGKIFNDYSDLRSPVDFVIKEGDEVLAIGLARYDGDRGGSQEDDRIKNYSGYASEFFKYSIPKGLKTKILYINDGPGLLLGSMWRDYSELETRWGGKVMIATLRMVPERMTLAWLHADIK